MVTTSPNLVTRKLLDDSGSLTSETQMETESMAGAPGSSPTSYGRYAVIEVLGEGGMGQVWRAYDPKLEREVALKVIKAKVLDKTAEARLVREARAMAKLSHPNVVLVYDVDRSPSGIMLVMECVRGQTLRRWLKQQKRSRSEILARFIEAGQGLAAAHSVGLLHRDFKPSNVLISTHGVAKVTDFGLAKVDDGVSSEATERSTRSGPITDNTLTETNVILGTPRYMAPEQYRGDTLGPEIDQYAFCVALWEALAGVPPFVGAWQEIEAAKMQGPPPWPTSIPIPRPLVTALRRGLEADPVRRWPSLSALLDVLTDDPSRRRRYQLLGAGILSTGAIVAGLWTQQMASRCSGATEQLSEIWNMDRRNRVESALLATEVNYAQDLWQRIEPSLQSYADEWKATYTDACEAAVIRNEQSLDLMDLRMNCLDQRKMAFKAVVDIFAAADAQVVHRAHQVVDGLEPLQSCSDVDALLDGVELPIAQDIEAVDQIRQSLAEARISRSAIHYDQAKVSLDEAVAIAESVDYPPVHTEVLLEQAEYLESNGDYAEAEQAYRGVLKKGTRLKQRDVVQRAVLSLLSMVGMKQLRPEYALAYVDLAEGLVKEGSLEQAKLYNAMGTLLGAQGKFVEEEAKYLDVLEILSQLPDEERASVEYEVRSNLGLSLREQGKFIEAESEFRYALTLAQEALGPRHPAVAFIHTNIGEVLHKSGRFADAVVESRRALDLMSAALGDNHPDLGGIHNSLGNSLRAQEKFQQSTLHYQMAIKIWMKSIGPEHVNLAIVHNNMGLSLAAQEKYEDALAEYQLALDVWEKTVGLEHPNIAVTLANRAEILVIQGQLEDAISVFQRSVEIRAKALGAEHPGVLSTRSGIARILVAQEKYAEAETELSQILELQLKQLEPQHPNVIQSYWLLGIILDAQGHHSEAESKLRHALTLAMKVWGEKHSQTAAVRESVAKNLLNLDRVSDARATAEKAWDSLRDDEHSQSPAASAAFTLARALWAEGAKHRPRARKMAERALELYSKVDLIESAKHRQKVEEWLSTHR